MDEVARHSRTLIWGSAALQRLSDGEPGEEEEDDEDDEVLNSMAIRIVDGALLSTEWLHGSAKCFPQELELEPNEVTGDLPFLSDKEEEGGHRYDPRWVYPLLGYLLPRTPQLNLRKLVHTGLFSFILAGLSSHTLSMRRAAYTLVAFCQSLLQQVNRMCALTCL